MLRPGYQRLLEDAAPAVRRGRRRERWTGCQPRPGAHRGLFKQLRFCRRAAGHPGRGRDQRAACRPQGHDERALPQGPGAEDPSRAAGPGRGRAGRAAACCYGYDVVREPDARRRAERGKRRINPAEAAIVRRIFREYAAGAVARRIAHRLNREGVPGPRGGAWGPPTIAGNADPRHRHPQQRALRRPAGLEPAALHQGPEHRQAGLAAERRRPAGSCRRCPSCGSSTRSSGRP